MDQPDEDGTTAPPSAVPNPSGSPETESPPEAAGPPVPASPPAASPQEEPPSDPSIPSITWDEVRTQERIRVELRRNWFNRHMPPERDEGVSPVCQTGLALSGGGIRSATFSVGVLRSLSRLGLAHKVDYLSTVSGGGYAGSFYCSLFVPDLLRGATPRLDEKGAAMLDWVTTKRTKFLKRDPLESDYGRASFGLLREGGNYLMPAGTTDTFYAAVVALRNWLAVALISGLGILSFFLIIGFARVPDTMCGFRDAREMVHLVSRPDGGCADRIAARAGKRPAPDAVAPAATIYRKQVRPPADGEEKAIPLLGTSYLWIVVLLLIPLWLQPASWAYWMTRGSPFPRNRWQYLLNPSAIVALAAASVFILLLAVDPELRGSAIALPVGAASAVGAVLGLVYYIVARMIVREDDRLREKRLKEIRIADVDADRVATENRIRTKLSRWLYRGFVFFICLAVLALVDDLARGLYLWSLSRYQLSGWGGFEVPGSISVLAALLVPVARWLLSQGQAAKLLNWPRLGPLLRRFGRSIALIVALVLLFGLMIFWAAIAYEILWHDRPIVTAAPYTSWSSAAPDAPWAPPLALTLFVIGCAFVLGHVRSFLNQSSLASFYIGRLRKAYLGSTNAKRAEDKGLHTDLEHPLDDITLKGYYHHSVLAPVHLINVTVNETTAASSRVIQRDRKGKSMTISPAGYVTTLAKPTDDPVGFPFDGLRWSRPPPGPLQRRLRGRRRRWRRRLRAAWGPPRPAVASERRARLRARLRRKSLLVGEQLPLSAWIGISGAAFSTGIGRNTTLGQSLLAALVNMRLGYWWDSPVPPRRGDWLFGDLVHRYLLREARAEYEGTHTNRWYLSDGGHYENTGIYELVRRRIQLIVGCDNGADPDYMFADLVSLIRKLRIDFDAETVVVGNAELDRLLGTGNALRAAFGELEELGPRGGDGPHQVGPYAALARIHYRAPRDRMTPPTTLILVKPRLGGAELPDLVRYKASNAAFPQQPTTDQFFDEDQWESYFRLGQLIADTIFEPKRPAEPESVPAWTPSSAHLHSAERLPTTWWPSELRPLP